MSLNFLHRSAVRRGEPQQVRAYLIDWEAARRAERACCCPAKPVVVVVMPAAPGRPHRTDLLLCGHHYRVSEQALAAAGATVTDIHGTPVTGGAQPPARAGV
jgi:hypothetical protein